MSALYFNVDNSEDMNALIKTTKLRLAFTQIMPDHVNLKNFWVSFYISERILNLCEHLIYFSLSQLNRLLQINSANTIWR